MDNTSPCYECKENCSECGLIGQIKSLKVIEDVMDKYLDKNEEIEINNAIEKLSNIGINLADTQGEREFYKIGFRDGFEYQKNKSSENPSTVKKITKDLP
jgi:hypothetical protein